MLARLGAAIRFLLCATGALLLGITFTPIVPWTAAQLTDNWTESDHDILVVLSGSTIRNSVYPQSVVIGGSSYWRVVHAVWAWQHGRFRNIVLVGAGSEEMRRFLIAYDVPGDAISVETRSTSTRENALFAKPLLDRMPPGRVVLLTSDYHMYRAARCFRRAGIAVATRPFPDLLKSSNTLTARWQGFWLLSDELASILYYRARGWM
jgi:uncharacterized SAM-binding protein YcdF (DUF218 family)